MITRGTKRFVDEVRDHKDEHTQHRNTLMIWEVRGKRSSVKESNDSIKETCIYPAISRFGEWGNLYKLFQQFSREFFVQKDSFTRTKENGLLRQYSDELYRYKYPNGSKAERSMDFKNSWAIQIYSGNIPILPKLMGFMCVPDHFDGDNFIEIVGGAFPHLRILLFKNQKKKEHHDDYTIPQKVHYHNHWKCSPDLQSHLRSSLNFLSGDCIFRVIFEKKEVKHCPKDFPPRSQFTLKSNWLMQWRKDMKRNKGR